MKEGTRKSSGRSRSGVVHVQQSPHEASLEKSIDNVHKHNKTTATVAAATTTTTTNINTANNNNNNNNKALITTVISQGMMYFSALL